MTTGRPEDERDSMLENGEAAGVSYGTTRPEMVPGLVLSGEERKPTTTGREKEFFQQVCDSLDLFKGLLVAVMVWAHVDLAVVNPAPTTVYSGLGHAVGNTASAMCFLGYMLSYGFTCDFAYLTDFKQRSVAEQAERMARSVCLPIVGAWICNLCWAFFFFKLPFESSYVIGALTFYNVYGNGPDFILCFSTALLIAFCFKDVLNRLLDSPGLWHRIACVTVMLSAPLCLCFYYIPDCRGAMKYAMFLLECDAREQFTNNLPALPHLFYFNLGVLLSRYIRSNHLFTCSSTQIASWVVGIGIGLSVLALPLYSTWATPWGNLSAETEYGWVRRGFQKGPSILWLLGNLFALYVFFLVCLALEEGGKKWGPVKSFCTFWEHFGANVLIYLILSNVAIAGMFRNQFPLHALHGGVVAAMVMVGIRFLHYIAHSSRK